MKTFLMSVQKVLVPFSLLGALFVLSPTAASATVYTFTEGSPSDAVKNFSFTTSLSGAQLDNVASGTNITSSVTDFTFPVNFILTQDAGGFAIGMHNPVLFPPLLIGTNGSCQITSWTISLNYFPPYPPLPGRKPTALLSTYP